MKFEYSPGLYGYGLKGTDASSGIAGLAIYFTDYNAISDHDILEYDISNNYVLWSSASPGTSLPGGRKYNEGDLFITQYGDLYEISFNPIKYLRRGTLNLNKYFDTHPNAATSNFQYQRYSNISDEGNRFIIDNVQMEPIIDYTLAPSNVYGINAKDYNRIEYSNILNNGKNAYSFFSSTVALEEKEKGISIIRENDSNTFRIGNYSSEDGIREVNLSLDVNNLKRTGTTLSSDATLGSLLTNQDVSMNCLYNPIFNYDPSTFTVVSTDPCTIKVSWKLNGFTSDTNILGDLYFYEISTGLTPKYVFNNIDASGSVNIQKLKYLSTYGSYIKIYKNGWSRTSILKSLLCDAITKYLEFKTPSTLIIDASANGKIAGASTYTTDFSTNSTTGWSTTVSNNWITCTPSSSTNINKTIAQHFDVSISNYTLDVSRSGYIDVTSEAPTKRIIIRQDASVVIAADVSVYLSALSLNLSNLGSKVVDVSIMLISESEVFAVSDYVSGSGEINVFNGLTYLGGASSFAGCGSYHCHDTDYNTTYISLVGLTSSSNVTFSYLLDGWQSDSTGDSASSCTLKVLSVRKTSGTGNVILTTNQFDAYYNAIGDVVEAYSKVT